MSAHRLNRLASYTSASRQRFIGYKLRSTVVLLCYLSGDNSRDRYFKGSWFIGVCQHKCRSTHGLLCVLSIKFEFPRGRVTLNTVRLRPVTDTLRQFRLNSTTQQTAVPVPYN